MNLNAEMHAPGPTGDASESAIAATERRATETVTQFKKGWESGEALGRRLLGVGPSKAGP